MCHSILVKFLYEFVCVCVCVIVCECHVACFAYIFTFNNTASYCFRGPIFLLFSFHFFYVFAHDLFNVPPCCIWVNAFFTFLMPSSLVKVIYLRYLYFVLCAAAYNCECSVLKMLGDAFHHTRDFQLHKRYIMLESSSFSMSVCLCTPSFPKGRE